MSKRANRRNRGNGHARATFHEQIALLPEAEANRLSQLGANVFTQDELELIGNTAVAITGQGGRGHPTVAAALIAAGVVADMVIRCVQQHSPPPTNGEQPEPLVAALASGLTAGRRAAQAAQDDRCGRPLEEGEDLVLRAQRSGLVIAH